MAGTRLGAFSYQTLAIAFSCVLLSLFPPIRQSGERLPTEGHIVVSQMHFSRVIKELKLHCPGPMRRRRRLQPRGSGRRHPWQQFQAHYPKSSERKVSRERQLSCKRIHAGMTLEFRGFERERKSSGLSQILYKKMYIIIKKMHLIVNRVFFFSAICEIYYLCVIPFKKLYSLFQVPYSQQPGSPLHSAFRSTKDKSQTWLLRQSPASVCLSCKVNHSRLKVKQQPREPPREIEREVLHGTGIGIGLLTC